MRFYSRLVRGSLIGAAAAALCVAGMAGTALAASSTWPTPTSPMTNTVTVDGQVKQVVTASANGCYRTFPEILGLSNPLCNPGSGSKQTDANEALIAQKTDNDYGLYGSPANNSPDAYMWNYNYNFYANAQGLTKADPAVTCITCNAGAAGMDTTAVAAYGGINATFYHRPDIAYGQGTVSTASDGTQTATAYANFVDKIHTFVSTDEWYHAGDETYNPTLIDARGGYGGKLFHIDSLYEVAEAAQKVIDDSDGTKTTRYGDDAYQYAVEFEKLVRGTNYAVMKAIDEKKTKKKTIAYVNTVDTETKEFALTPTDVQVTSFEQMYQGIWGGTCIRYMYGPNILENITNNIGDVNKLSKNEKGQYIATAKDLAKCDAIIVRTGSGMGDCDADAEKIKQLMIEAGYAENQIPDMYYKYPTFPGGGGGNYAYVSYYPTMIGFVYPEVINPSYIDAYYAETVYHVASTYLEDAMNILFAKATLPSGYSLDLSGYSYQAMSDKLNAGLRFYMNHKADIDKNYPNMTMTKYLQANVTDYATTSLANAVVTLSSTSATYTGKAQTPAVKVTLSGKTLTQGEDYLVTYANNTNAGIATVTVRGIDEYGSSVSKRFTIDKAKTAMTAKAKKASFKKSAKKAQTTKITVSKAQGKVTYKSNKKAVTVSKTGKVTIKKGFKGTAKITVKCAGSTNYANATKTVTIKVK